MKEILYDMILTMPVMLLIWMSPLASPLLPPGWTFLNALVGQLANGRKTSPPTTREGTQQQQHTELTDLYEGERVLACVVLCIRKSDVRVVLKGRNPDPRWSLNCPTVGPIRFNRPLVTVKYQLNRTHPNRVEERTFE